MAKIGIYGGSFNPVHFGHTGLAEWILRHSDLDELWMLVTPNNPLKPSHNLIDERTRLRAVEEAISDINIALQSIDKRIVASDFEFSLPRPSYTANTLRALSRVYAEHEFVLVIGEDNWELFRQWKEWEYILEHYQLFIYPRHSLSSQPLSAPLIRANEGKYKGITWMEGAPYFDISSTEIREKQKKDS